MADSTPLAADAQESYNDNGAATATAQQDNGGDDAAKTTAIAGGVDRSHGSSAPQKVAMFSVQIIGVGVAAWILLGGITTVGKWFGTEWSVTVPFRAYAMLGSTVLYLLRNLVTLAVLLKRRVTWGEGLGLSITIAVIEIWLAMLACGIFWPTQHLAFVNAGDIIGIVLVVIGSFLNTYSELQRHWWKQNPSSKGHCYTEGLWKYSMHINYFGDSLLFTGWIMLTATFWMAWLPLLMTAGFVWFHIPSLDAYLADRYGEEFKAYAAKTKKLIPFVY